MLAHEFHVADFVLGYARRVNPWDAPFECEKPHEAQGLESSTGRS